MRKLSDDFLKDCRSYTPGFIPEDQKIVGTIQSLTRIFGIFLELLLKIYLRIFSQGLSLLYSRICKEITLSNSRTFREHLVHLKPWLCLKEVHTYNRGDQKKFFSFKDGRSDLVDDGTNFFKRKNFLSDDPSSYRYFFFFWNFWSSYWEHFLRIFSQGTSEL